MRSLFIKLIGISLTSICCFSGNTTLAVPAPQTQPQESQQLMLQTYLNGIRTLQAKFTQTNPDHTITHGTMYLKRLGKENFGKLRLEYAPPSNDRIIANGEVLRHVDGKTKDISEYSIDSTPASFLLSRKIDFSDDLRAKSIENKENKIYLTLCRPGDDGVTLTLIFVTSPMLRLQEWTLVDAQRNSTHVVLRDVRIGDHVDDSLFRF